MFPSPCIKCCWQMVFMDFVGYIVALGAGQSVQEVWTLVGGVCSLADIRGTVSSAGIVLGRSPRYLSNDGT